MDEALLDNFFDRSSYLYEEPGNLLKQELREPAIYNAIIKAIAEGASRMNDIKMKVEVPENADRPWHCEERNTDYRKTG